jgi:hypothetical protein
MATAGAATASLRAVAETIAEAADMPPITAALLAAAVVVQQFAAVAVQRGAGRQFAPAAAELMQRLPVAPVERALAAAQRMPQQHGAAVVVVAMQAAVAVDTQVAADMAAADAGNRRLSN